MVNENKVKLLTKLAVFEKKTYRSSKDLEALSRGRYVAKGVWWAFVAATFAFIFALVIWTLYSDTTGTVFFDFLNGETYMFTNVRLWIEYSLFTAGLMIISLIVYNKRYTKLSEELEEYRKRRNNYEEFYNRKEKQEQ